MRIIAYLPPVYGIYFSLRAKQMQRNLMSCIFVVIALGWVGSRFIYVPDKRGET